MQRWHTVTQESLGWLGECIERTTDIVVQGVDQARRGLGQDHLRWNIAAATAAVGGFSIVGRQRLLGKWVNTFASRLEAVCAWFQ